MARSPLTLSARLVLLAAFALAIVLPLGTLAAAAPTVTADPALVPFGEVPGQPGVTTLTFAANGAKGLAGTLPVACGQDNANAPFGLGTVAPETPLVISFPFIQAGKYTFWVSTSDTCALDNRLGQVTVTRLGPTGKAGQDDISFLPVAGDFTIAPDQQFPLPGEKVCIMSGDGMQVSVVVTVGQDPRPQGLGAAAVTTTVKPFAGQNGCFPVPWVVNGFYQATIGRSPLSARSIIGFCANALQNTICSQEQIQFDRTRTTVSVTGPFVTGGDAHAAQVCVAALSPIPIPGAPAAQVVPDTVNAYNQSGALNMTPLALNLQTGSVVVVTLYDIIGPMADGRGGLQFTCPGVSGTTDGSGTRVDVNSITLANRPLAEHLNFLEIIPTLFP